MRVAHATSLVRMIHAVVLLGLLSAAMPALLKGAEPRIVALHGLAEAEVRHQGFTLARPMTVHVYARGGGIRQFMHRRSDTPLFAYGWILNAATREVVWQMDGPGLKRDWDYLVADQYLPLPAGSYEAYFANHGFGQSLLFAQWTRNIDRRDLGKVTEDRPRGFLAAFGADEGSLLRHWQQQVGNYGMEVYLSGAQASEVASFEAPLMWRNAVVRLAAIRDQGHWMQALHVRHAVSLHVYAEGEISGRTMVDFGWIVNARTRERVWEMSPTASQFAGGARKNRRQVETLQLPAGDYEAHFVTDDSHSPADWNGAPPCDPGLYGLTLSVPADKDVAAVSLTEPLAWKPLAELVRVGDDQDRRTEFTLAASRSVRVYAIGEGTSEGMADEGWIEDAAGHRVWSMERGRTQPAGGASKNRVADEVITLPKGTYTLRYRTDDSHAYGDWNSGAPWDAEHYGVTVYATP